MRNTTILATVTLMLNFGVAEIYAQAGPVNMTLSGTAAGSTVNLGTGTGTAEYNLAGKGPFGSFTLRTVSSSAASPQQSSTCSGSSKIYFPVLAGAGVFRFQDGDLLKVDLTGGSDCIDFAAGEALCTRVFQIIGGTGRFKDASGNAATLTMTVAPVVPGKNVFFTVTATFAGTISGVAAEAER